MGSQDRGWKKADVEGPLYLVRRAGSLPHFQLILRGASDDMGHPIGVDLRDGIHADWETDFQPHYVFYKTEDTNKQIRGLWFHSDAERQKLHDELDTVLDLVRKKSQRRHVVLTAEKLS